MRKECLKEENYQRGLWQENYLDGQIRDILGQTGKKLEMVEG